MDVITHAGIKLIHVSERGLECVFAIYSHRYQQFLVRMILVFSAINISHIVASSLDVNHTRYTDVT